MRASRDSRSIWKRGIANYLADIQANWIVAGKKAFLCWKRKIKIRRKWGKTENYLFMLLRSVEWIIFIFLAYYFSCSLKSNFLSIIDDGVSLTLTLCAFLGYFFFFFFLISILRESDEEAFESHSSLCRHISRRADIKGKLKINRFNEKPYSYQARDQHDRLKDGERSTRRRERWES